MHPMVLWTSLTSSPSAGNSSSAGVDAHCWTDSKQLRVWFTSFSHPSPPLGGFPWLAANGVLLQTGEHHSAEWEWVDTKQPVCCDVPWRDPSWRKAEQKSTLHWFKGVSVTGSYFTEFFCGQNSFAKMSNIHYWQCNSKFTVFPGVFNFANKPMGKNLTNLTNLAWWLFLWSGRCRHD